MFKYTATLLIAVMAASASLAVSVPIEHQPLQEPAADSSNVVALKKQVKPNKIVFMSEVSSHADGDGEVGQRGLLDSGLSGLSGLVSLPKKIIGAVASSVFDHLKSMNLKKLVKISLLAALVTVLGAVAAVAVAGLVSMVSAVCAALPYLKLVFGGHHGKDESESESQIDLVSEFVLGALEQYGGGKRKA